MKKLKELENILNITKKMRLAVVAAEEENVLIAVDDAFRNGIITPVLIGNSDKIEETAEKAEVDVSGYEIIQSGSMEESAEKSVRLVHDNNADFLIKGLVDTGVLMKQVLNKDYGLKSGSLLSHVMLYEVPSYHKILFLTDGGMVTYPDVNDKKELIIHAAKVARALGYDEVKVACLAAKEKVNEKMQATVDGAKLKKMYEDGEFGKGIVVEGPIAMDLAVSDEAARIKGYKSPVAGDADVLLAHNIEMGNGIGKTMTYMGNAMNAGIITGAKAPIVLVSRSDSYESKYYSILLGAVVSQNYDR